MCVVNVDPHMARVCSFVYDKIALILEGNAAIQASFSPVTHLKHSFEMRVCVWNPHTHGKMAVWMHLFEVSTLCGRAPSMLSVHALGAQPQRSNVSK